MTGKCPKCEKSVSSVVLGHVRMSAGLASRAAFHGIAYLCPFCDAILGVGVDPMPAGTGDQAVKKTGRKKKSPSAAKES